MPLDRQGRSPSVKLLEQGRWIAELLEKVRLVFEIQPFYAVSCERLGWQFNNIKNTLGPFWAFLAVYTVADFLVVSVSKKQTNAQIHFLS